ncbi:hypothetical protein RFI_08425, partial [Reticulomyxa filosa]
KKKNGDNNLQESGITMAGLMIVYSGYIWLKNNWTKEGTIWTIPKSEMQMLLLRILLPLLYVGGFVYLRHKIVQSVATIGKDVFLKAENPIAFEPNRWTRIFSTAYVHSYYLRLLLFPYPLCADYSFNCIPLIETWSDARNLVSCLCYALVFIPFFGAALIILLFPFNCLFRKANVQASQKTIIAPDHDDHDRLEFSWIIFMSVLWLIVPFIPASNLFFYIGTFVAERLLYVPSIGFCMGLSLLISWLTRRMNGGEQQTKFYAWAITGGILVIYIKLTMDRNLDWRNEEVLFRAAYQVCPQSVNILQNHVTLIYLFILFF